jgi:alkanesulfonate monooxygenase SsuD/methylene tetrahydromethanopterin reductase-like flavin-dependent oxidoreductase (luciferase family)
VADYFEVPFVTPASTVLADEAMPGAVWFPGARLNYVAQVFAGRDPTAVAIVGTGEDVAEGVAHYRDLLGAENVLIFPQFAGDPLSMAEEQLHRFWDEVVPLV